MTYCFQLHTQWHSPHPQLPSCPHAPALRCAIPTSSTAANFIDANVKLDICSHLRQRTSNFYYFELLSYLFIFGLFSQLITFWHSNSEWRMYLKSCTGFWELIHAMMCSLSHWSLLPWACENVRYQCANTHQTHLVHRYETLWNLSPGQDTTVTIGGLTIIYTDSVICSIGHNSSMEFKHFAARHLSELDYLRVIAERLSCYCLDPVHFTCQRASCWSWVLGYSTWRLD